MVANRHWTKAEIEYLANEYPTAGLYETTRVLERSVEAVMSKAKRMGIKSKCSRLQAAKTRASHVVDQSYFDELNTYSQSYLIGFALADGCLSERVYNTGVTIEVHNSDLSVLDFYKSELKLTAGIVPRKDREMSNISIPTFAMCALFKSFGVVPRKSAIVSYPSLDVSEDVHRGIVAGYFDGDGSAHLDNRKRSPLVLSFTSNSPSMLYGVTAIIYKYTGLSRKNVSGNKLMYHCNEAIRLAIWLYRPNEFHLERKRRICQPYLSKEDS